MPITPVCGRYVAVHFDVTVNTFVDEIEVYGKKETALTPPTNYTEIVPSKGSYLDRDSLGGDHDIILFHTGYWPNDESLVNNKKETFLPFIAYLDQSEKIVDTMFDSVMFLILQGKCPSGDGLGINGGTTVLSDWQMLLDMYFSDIYNLRALNDAAEEVKTALQREDYKVSVYLTCPYPKISNQIFGDYDGDGKDNKISTYDDCLDVCEWFVDECIRRFEEGNYGNLVLKGFFNNSEGLTGGHFAYEKQYAKDMCGLLHKKGLYSVMIPYYQGEGIKNHDYYGFDAVLMQPNVSFDAGLQDDPAGTMADFDETAKKFGLGIEMEVNSSIIWDYDMYAKYYIEYLRYGANSGLMTDTIHAYYNGAGDAVFGTGARSSNKGLRFLYDATYKFIKGTLLLPDDPFTGEVTTELEAVPKGKAQGKTGLESDWLGELNIKTRPKHGRITFSGDAKTFTFYAKDYVGEDGFEYDITSNGITLTRKVKINIVSDEESSEGSEASTVSVPVSDSEEASKPVKAKKTGFPTWGYAVIGAAVAVAGACVYFARKKKR